MSVGVETLFVRSESTLEKTSVYQNLLLHFNTIWFFYLLYVVQSANLVDRFALNICFKISFWSFFNFLPNAIGSRLHPFVCHSLPANSGRIWLKNFDWIIVSFFTLFLLLFRIGIWIYFVGLIRCWYSAGRKQAI